MHNGSEAHTRCWIYRSSRKEEMYLYLIEPDAFQTLPPELMKQFGTPSLVMELDLHPDRRLARQDVVQVVANLRERGFHLQMPPEIRPDLHWGD